MSNMRVAVLSTLVMGMLVALGACGPAPEMAVVEGTEVVARTAVAVEKAVTATAEPAPTEPPPTEAVATETVPTEPPPTEPVPEAEVDREGLLYPLLAIPETLEPHGFYGDENEMLLGQCLESLYEFRGDATIELVGAAGFEVSDDGRVYTIKLREDVVWSDGQPVVAQHYVDGVFRLLEMEGDMWELYIIEGAEAYDTGEATDPSTVGLRAVDDHTLEIRLAEPAPYLETTLPSYLFDPIRLDLIEALGARWADPGNWVCNGAYLLEEWVPGEKAVFVKNPDYWNADQVTIERVTFTQEVDAVASYENDELHAISGGGFLIEAVDYILADPVLSQEMHVISGAGLHYIGLNTLRPPTDDVRVRKALALAMDHQSIYEELLMFEDWEPPACTIPPSIMGYQPRGTCGHPYDPEQAQALLAEAGYPSGEGFPTLHVWVSWDSWGVGALEMMATMWDETLGITTEMHAVDWERYVDYLSQCRLSQEALAACELNLYYMSWSFDYGDPQNTLQVVFAPDSAYHYTGWENERYEELMALAGTEYDRVQRTEYYEEADKILVEEQAVILPVLYTFRPFLVKEGVTYDYPLFGPVRFKHWALP